MSSFLKYGDELLIWYNGQHKRKHNLNQSKTGEHSSMKGVIVGMG